MVSPWTGQKDQRRSEARAELALSLIGETPAETRANCLEGRSPATANRLLSAIGVLQREAEENGGPPRQRLRRFPEPAPRDRVLTEKELDSLDTLTGGLYDTGMRASEFLTCDLDGTVRDSKNGQGRKVPLTDRAREALKIRPRSYATLRRRLVLPEGCTAHTLRHTRITNLVRAGMPLALVAKFAGHRSIATTMKYTHLDDQDLEVYL